MQIMASCVSGAECNPGIVNVASTFVQRCAHASGRSLPANSDQKQENNGAAAELYIFLCDLGAYSCFVSVAIQLAVCNGDDAAPPLTEKEASQPDASGQSTPPGTVTRSPTPSPPTPEAGVQYARSGG